MFAVVTAASGACKRAETVGAWQGTVLKSGDTTTITTTVDQASRWPIIEARDSVAIIWRGEELARPSAILSLRDHRIVVAESRQLYVVSPGRDSAEALGRPGSGPGEFRHIDGLALVGDDTLLVWDGSAFRLTWLTLSGRTIRTRMVTPARGMGSARRIDLHAVHGGVILAWSRGVIHLGEPPDTIVLALSPFDADSPAVITSLPDQVWTDAGMFVGPRRTFGPRPLYAVAGSGALATASGEDYCILLQMPVSPSRTRICRAWRRERTSRLRQPPAEALAELGSRGAALQALVAAQEFGPLMNSIEEVRFDAAGSLWVRVVDSSSVYHPVWLQQIPTLRPAHYTWEVFGLDGRLERRVALPGRLRVLTIGSDAVWGALDEDDGSVSIGCVALASRSACP